jgi:2-phospho-L-lactate guanylyltransferase
MIEWAVVVPLKSLRTAKSRLAVPAPDRADLTLAMLLDTLDAVQQVAGCVALVVTDDSRAMDAVSARGVAVTGGEPRGDLNTAVVFGAATARDRWGDVPVALLVADVPAVRPAELREALAAAAAYETSFVADRSGDGTTLVCCRGPVVTAYGPGSAADHRVRGFAELAGPWPGLRTDVDTVEDLAIASALGLGRATTPLVAAVARDREEHATVRAFDVMSSSGDVVGDDGSERTFGADAFARSGLRLLRNGQRVRLRLERGVVTAITIDTLRFTDEGPQPYAG